VIYRLPVDALVVAILARLSAQVTDFDFFTMPPQGRARPYGRIARVDASEASDKDSQRWTVLVALEAYGIHPTMTDATSAISRVCSILTAAPEMDLADNWRIEWSRPIGSAVFQQAVDTLTQELFWLGTQSLQFRVADLLTHGA